MAAKPYLKKSDAQSINIQSYIRVRPIAPKEKRANVLEFGKREVTIKSNSESSKFNKTLTFDRVFEEDSKQIIVYNTVLKPMIKEVLQGYNCTVFAYGQTGTGKTYTMTGDQDFQGCWEENIHAGVVPRAMQDLFAELSILACEYQVSVSYMELYNEKLRSLLKDSDDTDIKLIDDLEGGVIVKGILPTPVKSKEEAFKLLQQGAEKRQVAATQMNMNSSRSHTIFTINVNIKETAIAGKDDILRCGKLHLVDLAGSENVSKSGASESVHKTATGVNKRLAEASNINKSLLTLGRVITCLTENNPHIPYRESKLTRFLQDSLGGKTKTCIIGTISPAQSNLDETESTLNYAYKARSIKNKPVKNQTISKKDFMQVASEEILKLKKDLEAVRQGEGFYISKESHEEMVMRMKELDDQVKDWHEKYYRIKESYEQTKEAFSSLSSDFDDKCAEYEELDNLFRIESERCKARISEFAKEIIFREYLIKEYEKTEHNLSDQAKTCKSVLENLLDQSSQLHDKIDRKQSKESENIKTLCRYKENVSKKVENFQSKLNTFVSEEKAFVKEVNGYAGTLCDVMREEKAKVIASISDFEKEMKKVSLEVNENFNNMQNTCADEIKASQTLGEEILEKYITLYKDLVESKILPSMKNMQDQIALIGQVADEGRGRLTMYEVRQADLISDVMENQRSLSDSVKTTVIELAAIREQSVKVEASFGSIRSSTGQTSEKLKKLQDLFTSLVTTVQTEIDAANTEASSAVEQAATLTERTASLVRNVQSDLEKYGHKSELVQSVGEATRDLRDYQQSVTDQIKEKAAVLLTDGDQQLAHIQKNINKNIHQMQVLRDEELEKYSRLEQRVNQSNQYVLKSTATYDANVDQFVGDITEKLQAKIQNLEKVLRKQLSGTQNKLQDTTGKSEELVQVVQELDRDLKNISYAEYVPLGSTPQRISKDRIKYPRKFDSTAPRVELVRQLREKYPETESVPNDSLDLKKFLPAGPFFNGEIQMSTEGSPSSVKSVGAATSRNEDLENECTELSKASLRRRMSTSMPDLKNVDDAFCAPSPYENKENTRIRSARKVHKTKIPDCKNKKKAVLTQTQNLN